MNLLVISGEFPPFAGGAGTYCHYLVKALSAQGHKITLITKHYKESQQQEKEIDLFLEQNDIHCIRLPYRRIFFLFSWKHFFQKFLTLHRNEFDFVILNSNIAQLLCSHRQFRPFLGHYITIHHGQTAYDTCRKFSLLRIFYSSKCLRHFYDNASANVAICEKLKLELERDWKMPHLFTVLNCIDTNVFQLTDKTPHTQLRLTTASRLIIDKNTEAVLRLFTKLHIEFPSLLLTIAGTGSEIIKLKTLAQEMGISSFTEFTGQLRATELCALYQKTDVFILLSLHENLPLVFLEANACEVPVIGSDVGGVKEAIQDGITGFLVPLNDEKEIYQKTKLLLENPQLRKTMGKAGRKRAEQNFNLTTLGRNFESLLKSLHS